MTDRSTCMGLSMSKGCKLGASKRPWLYCTTVFPQSGSPIVTLWTQTVALGQDKVYIANILRTCAYAMGQ